MKEPEQRPIDEIEDEIGELAARIDSATYRLLVLIREMDERVRWEDRGARSAAHYLSWRIGLDLGAAREKVRVAHALKELPRISASFESGSLSYSKVRAITRVASPQNEKELLEIAEAGTASHVEKLVRLYRRATATAEPDAGRRQLEQRELSYFYDEDGMLIVRAKLAPEQGAVLCRAVESAQKQLFVRERDVESEGNGSAGTRFGPGVEPAGNARSDTAPELSAGQRQADALAAVCEGFLANSNSKEAVPSDSMLGTTDTVTIHVDANTLADPSAEGRSELEGGSGISGETSRRIACDAKLLPMIHGKGGRLRVGRAMRSVSSAMRGALLERDRRCRFPGCGCTRGLQAHHVRHWADGGRTDLENLVLVCRFHHGCLHEGGFRVEADSTGEFRFCDRDGRAVEEAWRHPVGIPEALTSLRQLQAHDRFVITPETSIPDWAGEPMDYDQAVLCLMDANDRCDPGDR